MKLSVIIVSYNVKHFLSQCLDSLNQALAGLESEVIVIDNDSKDGSQGLLKTIPFSSLVYVLNDKNFGFAHAINQGIAKSRGEFVLILNPDTLVGANAINGSINYLDNNQKCGAVGVQMIDGNGNFLRESKRSIPTFGSAIFKFLGIASLFPHSKIFSAYYAGHLDKDQNHQVEVLTGAYMMTRKSVLEKVGGFDDQYFMYGEDIDISLQIRKNGYYNYYLGESSIVHFKGESTKKAKVKYHYHFFNSMFLFGKKNLSDNWAFIGFLKILILIFGFIKFVQFQLSIVSIPILRFGVYWFIIWLTGKLWAIYYFGDGGYYDLSHQNYITLFYAFIWSVMYYLFSNRDSEIYKGFQGIAIGLLIILILYGLAPLELRTSRAIILLSALAIFAFEGIIGVLRFRIKNGFWSLQEQPKTAILIGHPDVDIIHLDHLKQNSSLNYIGFVSADKYSSKFCLGSSGELDRVLEQNRIKVITFISESIKTDEVMRIMSKFGPDYSYLLYSPVTNLIIDSPNKNTQGFSTVVELKWNIASKRNRMLKRALDIFLAFVFIFSTPLCIWLVKSKRGWMTNVRRTLLGNSTWVGYDIQDQNLGFLPRIKPGILHLKPRNKTPHDRNLFYAREYSPFLDVKTIINSFTHLGNNVRIQ